MKSHAYTQTGTSLTAHIKPQTADWTLIPMFTVRHHALRSLSYHNCVRLSVCQSHSWTVSTWFDLQSWLQSSNRKSYTSFRLVPLLMTLKYSFRSFLPRLSFPRPFQQSSASFRVARSPSNSWASCMLTANISNSAYSPYRTKLFCMN